MKMREFKTRIANKKCSNLSLKINTISPRQTGFFFNIVYVKGGGVPIYVMYIISNKSNLIVTFWVLSSYKAPWVHIHKHTPRSPSIVLYCLFLTKAILQRFIIEFNKINNNYYTM